MEKNEIISLNASRTINAASNIYLASKPRYEILNGLRGVAAMLVAVFYLFKREGKCPPPWCRSHLLRFGGGGTFHHSRGIEY